VGSLGGGAERVRRLAAWPAFLTRSLASSPVMRARACSSSLAVFSLDAQPLDPNASRQHDGNAAAGPGRAHRFGRDDDRAKSRRGRACRLPPARERGGRQVMNAWMTAMT
jgi:hypothetical protein